MAGDLVGPGAASGARLRRVLCTEAHSWVLLEGGAVDFPTVECALLPGGWDWLTIWASDRLQCKLVARESCGLFTLSHLIDRSVCLSAVLLLP